MHCDLLEAGVDIERLNAVVFFRYLKSAIKFYQMVGRGTRIHEETQKYKFWLYDYTGVTDLFGLFIATSFGTAEAAFQAAKARIGLAGTGVRPCQGWERPSSPRREHFILSRRDGRDVHPVDETAAR
jgi:type I restriction enzyme R subunit